jgi:hypothetical protein
VLLFSEHDWRQYIAHIIIENADVLIIGYCFLKLFLKIYISRGEGGSEIKQFSKYSRTPVTIQM